MRLGLDRCRVACGSEVRSSLILVCAFVLVAPASAYDIGRHPPRTSTTRAWQHDEGLSHFEQLEVALARHTTPPGSQQFLLYSKWPRGVELMIGIILGFFVTILGVMAYFGCYPHRKRVTPPRIPSASSLRTLDCGRFNLTPFEFQEAFFKQFNWTLDTGASSRDHDCVARVYNSQDHEVASCFGRLMSMPNGEMHLASIGADQGSETWSILRRPAPSRRPGQLWDFKVCHANGTNHAEVKQRNATKCLVTDAVSKHIVMTVIGNFTYPVFLSGERSIHVWASQADGRPCMVAQCEARVEGLDTGVAWMGVEPTNVDNLMDTDTFLEVTSESTSYLPSSNVRFVVTTIANIDASLVLAVLLGLQDVHCSGHPDTPAELSSASTGSSWRGVRASSGGSTVATLGSQGRRQPRFFSQAAKAAAMPPETDPDV